MLKIKVIVLVCSMTIPRSDCELKNSLSHWIAGETHSIAGCAIQSMNDLGKTPGQADDSGATYEKVVCPDPQDPRYKQFYRNK